MDCRKPGREQKNGGSRQEPPSKVACRGGSVPPDEAFPGGNVKPATMPAPWHSLRRAY